MIIGMNINRIFTVLLTLVLLCGLQCQAAEFAPRMQPGFMRAEQPSSYPPLTRMPATPSLAITTPQAQEKIYSGPGYGYNILWTYNLQSTDSVKIELVDTTGIVKEVISPSVPIVKRSFPWVLTATGKHPAEFYGKFYRLKMTNLRTSATVATSELFIIIAPFVDPVLTSVKSTFYTHLNGKDVGTSVTMRVELKGAVSVFIQDAAAGIQYKPGSTSELMLPVYGTAKKSECISGGRLYINIKSPTFDLWNLGIAVDLIFSDGSALRGGGGFGDNIILSSNNGTVGEAYQTLKFY